MSGRQETEVLVVGEALIDIVESGGPPTYHVGGSPANVALGLGRLGRSVTLLTQLANDPLGDQIRRHLTNSRVTVRAVGNQERTSTATAKLHNDGQASYEFDITWGQFSTDSVTSPRIIHTGSVASVLEPGARSVRHLLRSHHKAIVTFDPNIRPTLVGAHDDALAAFDAMARLSTLVKMSDEDAAFLYPRADLDDVLDIVLSFGVQIAVITRGKSGSTLATSEDRVQVDSTPVELVDTIGAGDTYMASLIDSLLESSPMSPAALRDAGESASKLAAITVSRAGADLPWAHERQDR